MSFKSCLSGFSGSNCSPSHAMHCIRPVSGLESLSSLERQRNALLKNLANCCITMTGEINHTALKNPAGINQYLMFLRQSLCTHFDHLLFGRWLYNHLACKFVSPCPLLYFPFLLFRFFLFHFLFFLLHCLLFFCFFF